MNGLYTTVITILGLLYFCAGLVVGRRHPDLAEKIAKILRVK